MSFPASAPTSRTFLTSWVLPSSGRLDSPQRNLFGLLLVAVLLGIAFSSPAQAQDKRAGDTFYVKLGGGLSDYAGENNGQPGLDDLTNLGEFFDRRKFTEGEVFPYMLSGEIGYQLSPGLGVGLGYQYGQYPFASGVPLTTTPGRPGRGGDLGTTRHTIQVLGRYMVGAPGLTFSPYVDAGLNVSLGGLSPGVGHLVGIGVDASVTDRMSLFLEGRLNFTFGDEAVDGIATSTTADALSALPAVGLKFTFDRPAVPPRILELSGPAEVTAGEPAAFAARINEDEATRPLSYEWAFGDGRTATGLTPSHVYNEPGTYTVAFTARNDAGTARDSLSIEVLPPQPARILSIDAEPNPAQEGELVRFESEVEGGSPLTFEWDFGDGTTGRDASPTHTYEDPGRYTVRLVASNEDGDAQDSLIVQVERRLPAICATIREFNSVYFDYGSSQLTSEAGEKLQENADVLLKCPNLSVRVEGFAGPDEPNGQALSEARAQAVADFYEDEGVDLSRVQTSGEGSVEGVTGKKGDASQSRRVDTILLNDGASQQNN